LGYLRHIRSLNSLVAEPFLPWMIDGAVVGWLRPGFVAQLSRWPEVFSTAPDAVQLSAGLPDFAARSDALAEVIATLSHSGELPVMSNEPYPVTPSSRDAALCVIDRVAAAYFGVRSFGQHMNGYVREPDGGFSMWIGRRARDRKIFPGALDQMVAGGLPYGIELRENLVKECAEEAGMPPELASKARPVGALTYNRVTDRGFRPDLLYCYDIEIPKYFNPVNTDGEVEEFYLLPLEQVAQIVRETDDFKLNCNLVIIDFLVRHGFIGPERSDYLDILSGLRPPLGLSAAASVADVSTAGLRGLE